MANKITLGGDRLGSGDKIKVNLPNFQRSSHDQGYVFTTDQAFGTLVPALCQIGTRGDTFYLNDIKSLVRTLPTNGPVFGSVKQQIDVFMAPVRLYIGALHNNATGIGLKMEQVKLPVEKHITTVYPEDMQLKNPSAASVSPTSFSHYIGQKGSKTGQDWANNPYTVQALFKLMYWNIYKDYYANKQEEEGVVIQGAPYEETPTGGVAWYDETGATVNDYNPSTGILSNNSITLTDGMYFEATITEENFAKLYIKVQNVLVNPGPNQELDVYVQLATDKNFKITKSGNNIRATYKKASIGTIPYIVNVGQVTFTRKYTANAIEMKRFPLKNIDEMRTKILSTPIGIPLVINETAGEDGTPYNVETVVYTDDNSKIREARAQTMCGLGIKTHLSDIFNNWLQTDWIDGDNGINELTKIDTSGDSFTVNEFIFEYKIFRMMNRIAISDGSYDAWQRAVYGEDGRVITESPVFCGGYSCEIAFDEVVSNAATENEPLGSLAGRGAAQQGTKKGGRNIKIKCDEAMLIMVINSFTPRTTYCANEAWFNDLESMDDLHKPDLDGIAFQNLPGHWFAAWADTVQEDGTIKHQVIGKQPSWIEYTTAVNETHGSFVAGGELEHMVLNRSYQSSGGNSNQIGNATSYIDPVEFNVVFADQKLSSLPFWCQIGFDLTTRRKMSANQIPLL